MTAHMVYVMQTNSPFSAESKTCVIYSFILQRETKGRQDQYCQLLSLLHMSEEDRRVHITSIYAHMQSKHSSIPYRTSPSLTATDLKVAPTELTHENLNFLPISREPTHAEGDLLKLPLEACAHRDLA